MSDNAISLGKLQTRFESDAKSARAAERALKRAQDSRDATAKAAGASKQALQDATRAVLG